MAASPDGVDAVTDEIVAEDIAGSDKAKQVDEGKFTDVETLTVEFVESPLPLEDAELDVGVSAIFDFADSCTFSIPRSKMARPATKRSANP